MRKIMVVEDDPVMQKLIQSSLKHEFAVVCCFTMQEGLAKLQSSEEFALIIIDRTLPDGDGLSLCAQIRQNERFESLPLIFLSSRSTESDKVMGLYAGADDYMTKPFSPLELKARVQARLRQSSKRLFAGKIEVDLEAHRVLRREGEIKSEITLTPLEFKMLVALLQTLGNVLNRESLLNRVWGPDCFISDRVVDTHVSHLRKKLKDCDLVIEAMRGEGYRLVSENPTKKSVA